MKWFQHQSNSHRDFNVEPFIDKYGTEGYGLYWICAEIIAEKGINFTIQEKVGWKRYLISRSRFTEGKLNELLLEMAEQDLIDKKALEKGNLYMPKMANYSDDYTKRLQRGTYGGWDTDNVRSKSEQDTNNVGTTTNKVSSDKIRGEERRLDKIRVSNVFLSFQKLINDKSRLVDKAVDKIKTRLKSFTEEELIKAMTNFSKSQWWMEHNRGRGIAWFFNSDERIDQFLNLEEKLSEDELFEKHKAGK